MAGQGSLKIGNLTDLIGSVKEIGLEGLRSVGKLKDDFEGCIEQLFVRRLLALYDFFNKQGFDREQSIKRTMESLEQMLRKTVTNRDTQENLGGS